jgi:choline dehydrogenase-like flavoprotein
LKEARWFDLSTCPDLKTLETQICLIGAGAAGLYLATQLANQGLQVLIVEAGSKTCVDTKTIGFEPVFTAAPYPGATLGRFFGVGGSTARWGGALVPHSEVDRRDRGALGNSWDRIVELVAARSQAVLQQLGYPQQGNFFSFPDSLLPDTASLLKRSGIDLQSGLYLPFQQKNLRGLLSHRPASSGDLTIVFNAVAHRWQPQSGSQGWRLGELTAIARNGHQLTVRARQFVIAAGAIESTRLLLEMDESSSRSLFKPTMALGHYLGDHLSLPIADVTEASLGRASHLFAPRFVGDWMRSFRFLERATQPSLPRSFAHFIFDHQTAGFELAKTVLSSVQQRRLPSLDLAQVSQGVGGLVGLAYGRYAQSRLHIPAGTPTHLSLDMEQIPAYGNRISLTDRKDGYGRRVVSIDWQISDQDRAMLAKVAHSFLSKWPGAAAGLPSLQPKVMGESTCKPYDAYHPTGTCRLGDGPEAVVDSNLRVWGSENLWVVSTAVLPSAGTANPTFTLLCLAHDLADRLAKIGR